MRLIDFGIARVDRPDEDTRTQTTRFAGTTSYMAPEQLTGRPRRSSDIYAMGVIAYEMLAGRRIASIAAGLVITVDGELEAVPIALDTDPARFAPVDTEGIVTDATDCIIR